MMSNKQNISYDIVHISTLNFEIQGIEWDLLMMRKSYKLKQATRRKNQPKAKKLKKVKTNTTIKHKNLTIKWLHWEKSLI